MGERKLFDDEIQVKMISAMGFLLGEMIMPKKMKGGLIETYFKSGTVKSTYLYIDGEEVTDGHIYNPFYKKEG
jgi:antitoxin component YwqK of YwqJK toxin-antitoxin module